jgi:hypothetical protein
MTKKLHHIRRQLRFAEDEFPHLEAAAKLEHMPLAVWARQILVEAAIKIEAAHAEVERASGWARSVRSKKLLRERELR